KVACGQWRARLDDKQIKIIITSKDLQALSRYLILSFNRLVWIGRTAHKDTQFLAYLRLHPAERLRQQLSSIRFDLDSVAPFRSETAKMPVGKELCIAIEAARCLSKAATYVP